MPKSRVSESKDKPNNRLASLAQDTKRKSGFRLMYHVKNNVHVIRIRVKDFLARRPHTSFRRTRHRDYVRSLRLPGYVAFTIYVLNILWLHKRLFGSLVVVYAILTALLIGLASQEFYSYLSESLRDSGTQIFEGAWGELGKAGILLGTGMLGTLNMEPTELQRVYALILILFVWLTTVWLLRTLQAGQKPRLRDGLYNAGAPIVSTLLVSLALIVQLLPIVLAVIAFGAATASGLLTGGIESMLFWVVASLLAMLSLYWATTTFLALIVVTLPGMYPLKAFRIAGDLVVSRRFRILLRIVWLFAVGALFWIVTMIPTILLDTWLKGTLPAISWVPIVPIALLIVGSISLVWTSAYTYLLYRRIVEDDATPA